MLFTYTTVCKGKYKYCASNPNPMIRGLYHFPADWPYVMLGLALVCFQNLTVIVTHICL